jgi:hypothetical protein
VILAVMAQFLAASLFRVIVVAPFAETKLVPGQNQHTRFIMVPVPVKKLRNVRVNNVVAVNQHHSRMHLLMKTVTLALMPATRILAAVNHSGVLNAVK